MTNVREVINSPIVQGEDEQIAYTLTTTTWGSSPTSPAVSIYDSNNVDSSSDLLTGSPSVNGDVITTSTVQSLTAGNTYRLDIQFTSGGNVFEAYCTIKGER